MPKFLHALCCCLRPESYHKKNDSASDCCDSRGSPIGQATAKAQGAKSVAHLAGDLRQRLTPRLDTPKGIAVGQKAQISNNNNNNTQLGHEEQRFLLPRVMPSDANKKCLIVDLDETLVHSSFKPVKNADFVIPVEIDNVVHQVYVLKRPHTDQFLERVGALFECVLFTASLAKYADPVADLLDKRRIFRARLFREACVFYEGNYVKDLERLGRDLRKVLIVDNSPASYAFHPDNAIPVRTWFDDPQDSELLELLPLLEELARAEDIYAVLGTPSQQPRCLTPSEDMLLPPPMAPSSPITQLLPPSQSTPTNNNNNGVGSLPQQWRGPVGSRMGSQPQSPSADIRRAVPPSEPSGRR